MLSKGEEKLKLYSQLPDDKDNNSGKKKKLFVVLAILFIAVIVTSVVLWLALRGEQQEVVLNDNYTSIDVLESESDAEIVYPIVSTGQDKCYNNESVIECPTVGREFYGQDPQFESNAISYTDNGDGTVTDDVTRLIWQKVPAAKMSYNEAIAGAESLNLGGYDDWRVPTIKELYSLIDFKGIDPIPTKKDASGLKPFIDNAVFDFQYGDVSNGSRIIDSQWVTSNKYVSKVFNDQECFFGVNFADGRIKCYPTTSNRPNNNGYFVRYVRSNPDYGDNLFVDNEDGTVADNATNMTWMKSDSKAGMLWSDALKYCQDLSLANHDNWHLPNAKELQTIVDYSRSPDTTDSAAIDPIFETSSIANEAGVRDFPYYWTSTTHYSEAGAGKNAAYISFGRGMGNMPEFGGWIDVHGAGSQRSDPKSGVPADQKNGHGPQGDAIRSENYVRCVTDLSN